ncbi:MAG TPA: GNAT family N-acetyltransferase [Rhodanobacteraceae bacterium]|jgi:aminoglycoside 6'-N-acetyltransferase I
MTLRVRCLEPGDLTRWIALRADLWPDQSLEELDTEGRAALAANPPLVVFVADAGEDLLGFIEVGLRSVAEGCASSPTPYVEGWFVRLEARRRGVGRALMRAVEDWCRARGYTELGSDARADNRLSHVAHAALGFDEVETLVVFRKAL